MRVGIMWSAGRAGAAICALLALAGCARFNGYVTTYEEQDATIIETPGNLVGRPYFEGRLVHDGDTHTVYAQLAGLRAYEREEVVKVLKKRKKVYIRNDRSYELSSLARFCHSFGLLPVGDLAGRLVGKDGFSVAGVEQLEYETERPGYLTRLWHWTGWFTFAYPMYDRNVVREYVDLEPVVIERRKDAGLVRKEEGLAGQPVVVLVVDPEAQALQRTGVETDDLGWIEAVVEHVPDEIPSNTPLEIRLEFRGGAEGKATWSRQTRAKDLYKR